MKTSQIFVHYLHEDLGSHWDKRKIQFYPLLVFLNVLQQNSLSLKVFCHVFYLFWNFNDVVYLSHTYKSIFQVFPHISSFKIDFLITSSEKKEISVVLTYLIIVKKSFCFHIQPEFAEVFTTSQQLWFSEDFGRLFFTSY